MILFLSLSLSLSLSLPLPLSTEDTFLVTSSSYTDSGPISEARLYAIFTSPRYVCMSYYALGYNTALHAHNKLR